MCAAALAAQFTMRYSTRCVCNSVAYKLVTCMQSRAACAKHTAALCKPFQSVVLNALLLACMPCSRRDLSGRNE